ncbi:MAG: PAS domain-containing protein [Chloroflexota bacterium]
MSKSRRVLILDDDIQMCLTLEDILRVKGFEPLMATSGQKALEIVSHHEVAVALIDLKLEDMGGLEVVENIKILSPSTECILLTGNATQDSAIAAIQLGAFSYFLKPFDVEQLLLTIQRAAEKRLVVLALRENEHRLAVLMDNLPGMVFRSRIDHKRTMLFISRGCKTLTGYEPDNLIKNRLVAYNDLIYAEDNQRVWEKIQDAFSHNDSYQINYRILTKDGELKWVWEQGHQINSEEEGGNVNEGLIIDISERKQSEEALRRSETILKKAQEVAHLGSWVWHIPTNRMEWSDEMYHIFGVEKETFKGDVADIITQAIHPDDRAKVEQSLMAVANENKPIQMEYRIILPNQSVHTVWNENGELVLDEEGHAIQLSGVILDITEIRLAEERLRGAQKFADLGTLAAGMAHEMNSPLQVVTGSADSLLNDLTKQGQIEATKLRRYLENISRNSWRIAELVRALNLYARPTDSLTKANDLNNIIHDTLLLIEHQLKTWSNIEVQMNLEDALPAIFCNRNEITQVLINLLTNARDAMQDGGLIQIRSAFDSQKNEVVLEVQDSGMGIPSEILDKIFDPFFTTKPVGMGTGLGLAIVSGIIKSYGGHIEIKSMPRQGTTMSLIFPLDGTPYLDNQEPIKFGRYA